MAYNSVISNFFIKISSVALCTLAVAGCTAVDDTLGLNLITDREGMKVVTKSFPGVECYLVQDSLPSSNLGVAFFGVTESPEFGVTEASSVLQFLPGGFKDAEAGFGYRPVADTLKLFFDISTFTATKDGSKDVEQEFYIYESKADLIMDSTYYSTFNVNTTLWSDNGMTQAREPLFSFNIKEKTDDYVILKPNGERGEEFMKSLVEVEKKVYETDTAFHKKFKGLYIVSPIFVDGSDNSALPANKKNSQIFSAGLENSHLLLIAHNHDKDKLTEVGTPDENGKDNKDTIKMAYYFDDGQYSTNTSVNKFAHNYKLNTEIFDHLNDTINGTDTPVTKAYVQSLAGVNTYLRFSDKLVDELVKAKTDNDTTYRSMVINRAEIRFYLDKVTVPLMNGAPKRLGMYYNYKTFKSMPDYNYQYEQQGSTFDYGGYLDRSRGCYVMDIRTYIQQLMVNPATQRTMVLAPDVSLTYTFGEIVLNAPNETLGVGKDKKIEIQLTYTLVK